MPIRFRSVDRQFARFCRTGDAQTLGAVFDATAPELSRVAAWLAGCRADAEDLLQATFLSAIERRDSFGKQRRVVPWLIGIMSNHARNLRRGRERRARLSSESGRVTDPVSVAADREFEFAVAQARRAIGEPYAEVLDLHLARGMNANEIAQQLGRSAGTVRTQLVRGMRQLRQRLRGVIAVAVPVALARATQSTMRESLLAAVGDGHVVAVANGGAVGVTVTAGGVAMSKKLGLLVPLALFVIGAAIYLPWQAATPPAIPGETGLARSVGRPASEADSVSRAVHVADASRVVATQAADVWTIRGEIMHGSVAPLPHAEVEARLFTGALAKGDPVRTERVVSDANGAFVWTVPRPPGPLTLVFASTRPDLTVLPGSHTVLPDEPAPQSLLVIAFVRDCAVSGVVKDVSGRVIPDAWVKRASLDEPVHCDESGSFEVLTSATYGNTSMTAGAPGFVIVSRTVAVADGPSRVRMDFILRRARLLSGRVVDESGAPIVGARVRTFAAAAGFEHTDHNGDFTLRHLDPRLDLHRFQVEHADFATIQRTLVTADLGAPCTFTLQRGAYLRGRAVSQDGHPIAGARVVVDRESGYYGSSNVGGVVYTDDDGVFEVRGVAHGRLHVTAFARGFAPKAERLVVPPGGSVEQEVLLRMDPGHVVVGTVVDHEKRALRRIRITPQIAGSPLGIGADVWTAADGSFRIPDLPPGRVDLNCFGFEVLRKVEAGVAVGRSNVVVTMTPASRITGRVVDDLTGKPVPRFTIRFARPELRKGERAAGGFGVEWSKGVAFEDSRGVWTTKSERFAAGSVLSVEATADGYGPAVARHVVAMPDPDAEGLVLRLPQPATIRGKVIDRATGAPLPGARVVAFHRDHPLRAHEPSRHRFSALTDPRGSFEIEAAPAGRISLFVQLAGRPPTFDGPFDLASGGVVDRTVVLGHGATIRGTVVGLRGEPIAGFRVQRQPLDIQGVNVAHDEVVTDAVGRFAFQGLPGATYWLLGSGALADGSTVVYSREVTVAEDETSEVRLTPAGNASLRVRLTTADVPPESLFIRVWRGTAKKDCFTLVARGPTFVVRGLPAGDFRVRASQFEDRVHFGGNATVTLVEGAVAEAELKVLVLGR